MVGIHLRRCHELGLSIKCPRACAPRSPNFNVGKIEAPRGSLTRQEKNTRFCSNRSSKLAGNIEIGGAGGHDPVQSAPQPFISDVMVASCLLTAPLDFGCFFPSEWNGKTNSKEKKQLATCAPARLDAVPRACQVAFLLLCWSPWESGLPG